MRFTGFIGPSYQHQSLNVDAQTCVNLYPEINPLGAGKEREIASLVPTPGLELLLSLGQPAIRGQWTASNGTLFVVAGSKLYSISSEWVETELGELSTGSGFVSMADNGTHLVIVDGSYGYIWNMATSVFARITDVDFFPANLVTFLDGYFIFNRAGTQQFFYSGINDETFDGLDIATIEGSPDVLVGQIASNQKVYMFGTRSLEIYYNSGDADNPFQRVQGAVFEVGCASAPFTIAKLLDNVYWLGGDDNGHGVVYKMLGFRYEKITTPAIEKVIRDIGPALLAAARAWTYQQGGHWFYCLNLPGVDRTWVYDATTGFWHERTHKGITGPERHRAGCHAVFNGKNIVGDYENGSLYSLDPAVYTDNGTVIIRERAAPHLSKNLKRMFHHGFQLDMEVGVGSDGGAAGNDPKVILQWSDDGGHNWSDEHWEDIGKIGKTKTRIIWRRLGSSRDRVYRVRISDPVKVQLIGAELEVSEGAA